LLKKIRPYWYTIIFTRLCCYVHVNNDTDNFVILHYVLLVRHQFNIQTCGSMLWNSCIFFFSDKDCQILIMVKHKKNCQVKIKSQYNKNKKNHIFFVSYFCFHAIESIFSKKQNLFFLMSREYYFFNNFWPCFRNTDCSQMITINNVFEKNWGVS
jgi:hypothetical protein